MNLLNSMNSVQGSLRHCPAEIVVMAGPVMCDLSGSDGS